MAGFEWSTASRAWRQRSLACRAIRGLLDHRQHQAEVCKRRLRAFSRAADMPTHRAPKAVTDPARQNARPRLPQRARDLGDVEGERNGLARAGRDDDFGVCEQLACRQREDGRGRATRTEEGAL